MPDLPKEAVQAAVKAVKAKEWETDAPWSIHNIHNFDSDCAVCREDLPAVIAVALEAAAAVLAVQREETIRADERRKVAAEYEDLLGSIWLYIGWRYVTKQLTTDQKNLFADAVDADLRRSDAFAADECAPVDRWWTDTACEIGEARDPR